MANSRSAEKRARQARKRHARNRVQRSRLKTSIRKVLGATDGDSASEAYRKLSALLDRLATRRIIHPNKAARTKSRLAKRVKAAGGQP